MQLCEIARREAGIKLNPAKQSMVAYRLRHRLRELALPGISAYVAHLKADSTGTELRRFLDAISTNYTSFMRESGHYAVLAGGVRSLSRDRRLGLRLWCAAAATGEEAYSIAMVLDELRDQCELSFRLLATDISERALRAAVAGSFDAETVAPLSSSRRRRFLHKCTDPGGQTRYRIREGLRERIVFRRLNLAAPPFPMRGSLDFVFCRNVIIYFDRTTRRRLVAEIERLLAPGGVLFIGHSETLTGIQTGLKLCAPSAYRKPTAPETEHHP